MAKNAKMPLTSATATGTQMFKDRDYWIDDAINGIVEKYDIKLSEIASRDRSVADILRMRVISDANEMILLDNQVRGKVNALMKLNKLTGFAIARLLIATGDVKKMVTGSDGSMIVAKNYVERDGVPEWTGTYSVINREDTSHIVARAMSNLSPDATSHDRNSMYTYLNAHAPTVYANDSDKLVFCRNGVWDFATSTFTAYDDDDYEDKYGDKITLSKLPVFHPLGNCAVLSPDASGHIAAPVLHNDADGTDWTPENGLREPFEMDTEVGKASNLVIWQALQFMIRRMNGDPKLYHFWIDGGGRGHNGKSTIWAMFRRLISKDMAPGDDDLMTNGETVITCSVDSLSEPYILGKNILSAYAIASDESNSSTIYVQKCARVKNLARAQEDSYRQIYEQSFSYAFNGFLLQQSNKVPQFGEKTDSVVSHFVAVPFAKSFDDSRPYIKSDYVLREEVAEWLLYHVTVEMPCLSCYDADALNTLEPYKYEMLTNSMPSFQALDDIVPGLKMNFMPAELLYDLYLRWCDKNGVTGKAVVSAKVFRDDLLQYGINNSNGVEYTDKKAKCSVTDAKQVHPAIIEYRRSPHIYDTEFAMPYDEFNATKGKVAAGYLNRDKFVAENRVRVWSKGGIRRIVKWQDIKVSIDDVEIDEDAGKI